MKLYKCLLAIVIFALMSCEETIVIDTESSGDQVVIEGLVTNRAETSYVKLSRSRNFYETGNTERITNADVRVLTGAGVEIIFLHNPDNEGDKDGFYFPNPNFQGNIDEEYILNVEVDGEIYTAAESMEKVASIDSLSVRLNDDEFAAPEVPGRYYNVLFYAKEPQDTRNHYLFKFYRNDTLVKDGATSVYITDDELLGPEIRDLEIAGYYSEEDQVAVEMYSLTREAYIFYSDLANLINNDGGMFSPPPANPRTNLTNNAFGYFQVSAVDRIEMMIDPD